VVGARPGRGAAARSLLDGTLGFTDTRRWLSIMGDEADLGEEKRGSSPRSGSGGVMTTARDIMHAGAECIGEHETLQYAAQRMRDLDVGSLPICGDDDRLKGIITDRDIVIKSVAGGGDPAVITAGELAQGKPVTVDSGTDISDVLQAMESRQIRRVPVIENHRLVGMISEADLARHLPQQAVGEFVEAICAPG
jgi:CBS domain-containing protein